MNEFEDDDEEQLQSLPWYSPINLVGTGLNMHRRIKSMWTPTVHGDQPPVDYDYDGIDPFVKMGRDIWEAIRHNNVRNVEELFIQHGTDCINETWELPNGDTKSTFMMKAAEYGSIHVMRFLIECGADIHTLDCVGEQAIHYAARHCEPRCVLLLVNNGADVRPHGVTPLHLACSKIGTKIEPTKILDTMKILLDAGANANAKDICVTYTTPLQMVIHGAIEPHLVGILPISNGTYSNPVTRPVMDAVHMLVNRGAHVNEPDTFNGGDTPLHQALGDNNVNMVVLLMSCGAMTNIPNRLGETAMKIALRIDQSANNHFWADILINNSIF